MNIHYRLDSGDPIIEITGRTSKGESIVMIERGFKPYLHISNPSENIREDLNVKKLEGRVLDIEEIELKKGLETHPALKVTVKSPSEVKPIRDKIIKEEPGSRIYAADILFRLRYLYDNDMGSCIRIKGEPIDPDQWTADLVMELISFENIQPFNVDLIIMSFDIENSIKTGEIYMIGCVLRKDGKRQ